MSTFATTTNKSPIPYNPKSWPGPFPHASLSQIPRPLLTLPHPLFQAISVPRSETNLERLRLRRQRRGNAVALQRIQHRPVGLVGGRHELERRDHAQEGRVDLSVRQVRAHAHPAARPVAVVRRARALGVGEVALRHEHVGVFEMRGIVVGRPRVHVEGRPRGYDRVVVADILDTGTRQADRDDSPEAEDLFHERGDIGNFLLVETLFPSFTGGWVDGHDLGVGLFLDFLPFRRGEEAERHDHVPRDGVDPRGNHGQTDGFKLGVVEFRVGVFDDVPRDAGLVGALCDAVFEHVQKRGEVLIAALAVEHGVGVLARDEREAQERDVVLPVVAGGAEVGDDAFDVYDWEG